MSGHSKWANIKRDKAVNDAKKSNIFTKLTRGITVAAKLGGGDVNANSSLRFAVEKAREARMPKENIEKAIKKGTGEGGDGNELIEVVYEGFGPHGEAFYIKGITDNRNRTVAEVRTIFSKFGGNLGGAGSTAYIFTPNPEEPNFLIEITSEDHKQLLLRLLDELDAHDDTQDIYFNFDL